MAGGFTAAGEYFIAPTGRFVAGSGGGYGGDFNSGALPFNPTIDLNFAGGSYFGVSGSPATFLTTTNSGGTAVDASGNWTSFAANTPRITNLGLLVEESRTNGIRNNTMQGAVVPGTLPTNWAVQTSSFTGWTRNVVGIGTDNGINYVDLQFVGTPATATSAAILPEAVLTIAASSGQTWATSLFWKIQAGSLANVSGFTIGFQGTNSGAFTENQFVAIATPTSAALRSQRYSVVGTVANASTNHIWPFYNFSVVPGQPVDVTFRIGWPQLELGAFATSPILTTSVAVTRASDVVRLTTPPAFGTAGSVAVFQNLPFVTGAYNRLIVISDGTLSNTIDIEDQPTTVPNLAVFVGGVVVATTTAAGSPTGLIKSAGSWNNTTINSAVGGVLANSASSATPTGLTQVNLGARADGSGFADSYITRVALWPATALTGPQLRQITT